VQRDLSVHKFSTENIVSMIFKDVSYESEAGGGAKKTIFEDCATNKSKKILEQKNVDRFSFVFLSQDELKCTALVVFQRLDS
jgi:hypothetical protein